jgi:hypothetical protein
VGPCIFVSRFANIILLFFPGEIGTLQRSQSERFSSSNGMCGIRGILICSDLSRRITFVELSS